MDDFTLQFRGTPDQDRFVDGYFNACRIGSSSPAAPPTPPPAPTP